MRGELIKQFPKAEWYEYEPISWADVGAASDRRCVVGDLRLDQRRTIVCLDADIFGAHPGAVRHARDFAEGRDPAAAR